MENLSSYQPQPIQCSTELDKQLLEQYSSRLKISAEKDHGVIEFEGRRFIVKLAVTPDHLLNNQEVWLNIATRIAVMIAKKRLFEQGTAFHGAQVTDRYIVPLNKEGKVSVPQEEHSHDFTSGLATPASANDSTHIYATREDYQRLINLLRTSPDPTRPLILITQRTPTNPKVKTTRPPKPKKILGKGSTMKAQVPSPAQDPSQAKQILPSSDSSVQDLNIKRTKKDLLDEDFTKIEINEPKKLIEDDFVSIASPPPDTSSKEISASEETAFNASQEISVVPFHSESAKPVVITAKTIEALSFTEFNQLLDLLNKNMKNLEGLLHTQADNLDNKAIVVKHTIHFQLNGEEVAISSEFLEQLLQWAKEKAELQSAQRQDLEEREITYIEESHSEAVNPVAPEPEQRPVEIQSNQEKQGLPKKTTTERLYNAAASFWAFFANRKDPRFAHLYKNDAQGANLNEESSNDDSSSFSSYEKDEIEPASKNNLELNEPNPPIHTIPNVPETEKQSSLLKDLVDNISKNLFSEMNSFNPDPDKE